MEKIQGLINQVKVINDKYDTIQKINGENFNIFSILRVERREVITHSYFIYELLNPRGSHNQGDTFLQLFLKQILKKKEYKQIGSIIDIKREDPTNENRRIDFTIETSKIIIAIEMKIDAKDEDKQLLDYYKYIHNSQKKIKKLYYLTLDGQEASHESKGKLELNKDYFPISFYTDIYNWIERCIEKTATIPTLREGLVHYRNLIQKLTHKTGDKMDNNILELIKTPKDMKAMYTIHNKYAIVLAKKESEFWFELKKEIEKNLEVNTFNLTYCVNNDKDITNNKINYKVIEEERNKKDDLFGLIWQCKVDSFTIRCDIFQWNSNVQIEMDYTILKDENKIHLSTKKEILENIGFKNQDKEFRQWFKLKEKINFYGKGEPTFELFDNNEFNNLVKKTANKVVKTLSKVLDNKDKLIEGL